MADSSQRQKPAETVQDASLLPEPFKSNALAVFVESFGNGNGVEILDPGPICGENIRFFSHRVEKLHVLDMYRELSLENGAAEPAERVGRRLNYPDESFNGILLWDLVSRLSDDDARKMVQSFATLLKPGGLVVVFSSNEDVAEKIVNSFVVGEDFVVGFRPQAHLRLPVKNRQNRDILEIMKPFIPTRSFIYRNGIREFLFRSP